MLFAVLNIINKVIKVKS